MMKTQVRHKRYLQIHVVLLVLILCMMMWGNQKPVRKGSSWDAAAKEAIFYGMYQDGTVDVMQDGVRKNYRWAEGVKQETPPVYTPVSVELKRENGEWVVFRMEKREKTEKDEKSR